MKKKEPYTNITNIPIEFCKVDDALTQRLIKNLAPSLSPTDYCRMVARIMNIRQARINALP